MSEQEAAVKETSMTDVFEAYAQIEAAKARIKQDRAAVSEAKARLKEATENLEGSVSDATAWNGKLLEMVGEIRQREMPRHPMGWIDETTRPWRKFKLEGSEDRLEFRGIDDGKVRIFLAEGLMDGETFFPAGDITVEAWNDEYAAKVEGFTDLVGEKPVEETKGDGSITSASLISASLKAEPISASLKAEPPSGGQANRTAGGEDQSWRAVRLESLGDPAIPPGIMAKLANVEPPIETIGDLADFQAKHGEFWIKDIPGVGSAGAGKISDAMDAFWARRKKQ